MVHSCYRLEDQNWVAMTYWLVFRGHEQIFNFQSLIWLFFFRRDPNEWWASKWCRADGTVERDNGFHFCQCDQDAWANNLQNDSLSSVVLRCLCPSCRVGCGIAAHIRAGGKKKAVSHRKGRGQDSVLRNMSWVSCFHVLSPLIVCSDSDPGMDQTAHWVSTHTSASLVHLQGHIQKGTFLLLVFLKLVSRLIRRTLLIIFPCCLNT